MQFFFVAKNKSMSARFDQYFFSPTSNLVFFCQFHDRNNYPIGDNVHAKSNAFSGHCLVYRITNALKSIVGNCMYISNNAKRNPNMEVIYNIPYAHKAQNKTNDL